ncbi:hypothetical protein SAMN04487996_10247 [Dyadobacter soli]|uniref:Alpha-galactosidase n=1 Tax=Dyadobacter soli TaxID=659014 RepID=A0A1G6X2E6_9BACT|nr:hypothetical protein [Dyadobacter soli]SDD72278.1 hypothetical protein SAMN04487996_10247 [Dyadobacter soli]
MIRIYATFQLLLVSLCISNVALAAPALPEWTHTRRNLILKWDLAADKATLAHSQKGAVMWQGSLLPSFWYENLRKEKKYSKAVVQSAVKEGDKLTVALQWPGLGKGRLVVENGETGWRFTELSAEWTAFTPKILEMYLGASMVNGANVHPTWDRPFMPDWQSFGYCVPGAKAGTVQSYFRSWDFGHTTIALGNFGPSMGTPYGAAFPRPVLFAGMGSDDGWITIGAGSVPDAAMSLKIQSTRGCLQFLYREDLWGPPKGKIRIWKDLARIAIDTTARESFGRYYASFPEVAKSNSGESLRKQTASIWNTWGMWRFKKYPIRPIADFMEKMHNEVMVLDDPWESSQGSGVPDLKKFPDFYEDIAYIRKKGVEVGVWETIGWIKDTAACGLGKKDLILDKNGKPCMANWNFDPQGDAYYCMDFSSERTKKFLWDRTVRIMKDIRPRVIKLDFGYGLPSPDMGAPRDPALRGERHTFALMQQIAKAAKSVDPGVVIMGYGISPLWVPLTDLVSLDDQGDLWFDLHRGHQEWSVWASLLGGYGVAISGSSCYDWALDDGILLNSVILGSPGAVLPSEMAENAPVPRQFMNRRLAVNLWHRRTAQWEPRWYNSNTGNMQGPPELKCWGRLEGGGNLTALVLRELRPGEAQTGGNSVENISWTGKWALISQDNASIAKSGQVAVIPFAPGYISFFTQNRPTKIIRRNIDGEFAADQWTWADGKLTITVSEEEFRNTAGYLVHTQP